VVTGAASVDGDAIGVASGLGFDDSVVKMVFSGVWVVKRWCRVSGSEINKAMDAAKAHFCHRAMRRLGFWSSDAAILSHTPGAGGTSISRKLLRNSSSMGCMDDMALR